MSVITSVIPRLRCLLTTGLATLALLALVPQAHASSEFLNNTWPGIYPGSQSDNNAGCQLCHGNSTQNLNPYGADIALSCGATGTISQRIQAVEGLDSDGQGDSNLTEINANTQPGWTTGTVPVVTRGGCAPAGNNTYQDLGDVDPVGNQAPVADPNGPYNGTVGVPVTFNGNGSSDPDGTIVQYDWDFGDGTSAPNAGPTPSHTYATAGTFTVSLTVTDDGGLTNTATTTATIVAAAQDPIADPNGPYTGTTNVALTLNGGASFDPDGGVITQYDWDFGDGSPAVSVTTPTVSHTYTAAGTYTVTLTVVDDEGATSAPATTTATISDAPVNQPPVSDPNGP